MTQNQPVPRWHGLTAKERPQVGLLGAAPQAAGQRRTSRPAASSPRVAPPAARCPGRGPCRTAPHGWHSWGEEGAPRQAGLPTATEPGAGTNQAPKTQINFAHEQVEANSFI